MSKIPSARPVHNLRNGWQLFRSRRTMWQMIREVLGGRYRMSFLTTVVVFASITYVVFPFDLICDFIPVVGWIDDGIVIYLLLKCLNMETKRYIRFKAAERRG